MRRYQPNPGLFLRSIVVSTGVRISSNVEDPFVQFWAPEQQSYICVTVRSLFSAHWCQLFWFCSCCLDSRRLFAGVCITVQIIGIELPSHHQNQILWRQKACRCFVLTACPYLYLQSTWLGWHWVGAFAAGGEEAGLGWGACTSLCCSTLSSQNNGYVAGP